MRLPIRVATEIRARSLIAQGQRVLIALSGGPDSVALFRCMLELAAKRDLAFSLAAAHLHHGLRGKDADADEKFCIKLCEKHGVNLIRARVDTPKLAVSIKRSKEESARIARHAFLHAAAEQSNCDCVAVAHHADDRIETVLFRLCRGTGIAGLQGIGWRGPVRLEGEPDVSDWLKWDSASDRQSEIQNPESKIEVVRPLLSCSRADLIEYLRSKRQRYCTDETNFDVNIPRNAIRNLVLPLLEDKVHAGARAALWRLAEETESIAEARSRRRQWMTAFASMDSKQTLALPVSIEPPPIEELSDILEALRIVWNIADARFTRRHAQALQQLFEFRSGPKSIDLPGGMAAQRLGKTVLIRRSPPKAH
jgi:tRNA(Ile)-lysidine synthase